MEQKEYFAIPLTEIHADETFNCRGRIAPIEVTDLASDIQERGQIQPAVVREYSEEEQQQYGKKYRLIAGFRRYTACYIIESPTLDCVIRNDLNDEVDAMMFNLAENIQRKDLNILQEAKAVKRLLEQGLIAKDIGPKLGKSYGWTQIRTMLLGLPRDIQEEAAAGLIAHSQIRQLSTILNKSGLDACYDATRRIKIAKERGEKVVLTTSKSSKKDKKKRSTGEVQHLIDHMLESIEGGFHTRCLAWANGNISTGEIFDDIKKYSVEHGTKYGYDYIIPVSLQEAKT